MMATSSHRPHRRTSEVVTVGQALIEEFRSQPATRAWLEHRSDLTVRALSLMLGLPDSAGGVAFSLAKIIDNILAAEWERARQ